MLMVRIFSVIGVNNCAVCELYESSFEYCSACRILSCLDIDGVREMSSHKI